MKVLFWNIGERLTDKSDMLFNLINEIKPDIFCIAEGSYSMEECMEIESIAKRLKLTCYYSPLFAKKMDLGYDYVRNGLKVFYNQTIALVDNFEFEHQRESGRIIKMTIILNKIKYIFVFIHNYSKSGNREVTDQQRLFISTIKYMKVFDKFLQADENLIIMGDFNLEPWDNILRQPGYLETHFMNKHYKIAKRKVDQKRRYFNPITEKIISSNHENLCGTYFSDNMGWALYDYAIYDQDEIPIEYDIITKTEKGQILKLENDISKGFLNNGIDHLPITVTIKNEDI
jgi:exonuclease III